MQLLFLSTKFSTENCRRRNDSYRNVYEGHNVRGRECGAAPCPWWIAITRALSSLIVRVMMMNGEQRVWPLPYETCYALAPHQQTKDRSSIRLARRFMVMGQIVDVYIDSNFKCHHTCNKILRNIYIYHVMFLWVLGHMYNILYIESVTSYDHIDQVQHWLR